MKKVEIADIEGKSMDSGATCLYGQILDLLFTSCVIWDR